MSYMMKNHVRTRDAAMKMFAYSSPLYDTIMFSTDDGLTWEYLNEDLLDMALKGKMLELEAIERLMKHRENEAKRPSQEALNVSDISGS